MRTSATVLTALLALVVLAVALLPRWIDTPAGRRALIDALSELAGTPVIVEGAAAFDLLPRPMFTFARLQLGGVEASPPVGLRGRIDRVDLELAAAELLRGKLTIARLRIVRPDLELPEGRAQLAGLITAVARSPVQAAELIDGRLRFGSGVNGGLREVDLLLRADPSDGRRHVEARATHRDGRLGLTLAAGPVRAGGRIPVDLQLSFGPGGEYGELDFAGVVADGARFAGDMELAIRTASALPLLLALRDEPNAGVAGWDGLIPVSARVRLEAEGPKLRLEQGHVALPQMRAEFGGQLELGRPWTVDLDVRVPAMSIAAQPFANQLTRALAWPPLPDVAGEVRFDIERLELDGHPLAQLRGQLRADPGSELAAKLQALLPAGGRLSADARLRPRAAGETIRAGVVLTLPALAETLMAWGQSPASLRPELPQSLTAEIEVRGSATALSFDRLDLVSDATRLTLTGEWRYGHRPRLTLAGSVGRLALDPWLPSIAAHLGDIRELAAAAPFDLATELEIDGVVSGSARVDRARLILAVEEGRLRVDELRLEGLAGATVAASGEIELTDGALALQVEAAVPSPARLLRLADLAAAPLAVALGPTELRARLTRRGELYQAELTLGAQHLSAAAEINSAGLRLRDLLAADLRLDISDLNSLARASGLPLALPAGAGAEFGLRAALTRREPGLIGVAAHGRLAGTALTLDGEWRTPPDRLPEWAGRLRFDRTPPEPLVDLLYRLTRPLAGWVGPAPWQWPGAWPTARLATVGTRALALDLELLFEETGGAFRLLSAPDRFTIERLRWPVAGGQLLGELSLTSRDAAVAVAGRLRLEHADVTQLIGDPSQPPLSGRLELDLEFKGEGRSPAELVAGLDGSGRLALRQGALPDFLAATGPLPASEPARRLLFGSLGGEVRLRRGIVEPVTGALQLLADRPFVVEGRLDLYAWMIDALLLDPAPDAGGQRELARLFGPLDRALWQRLAAPGDAPSIRRPEHFFGPH